MSYNLLAESDGKLDWETLRGRLLPELKLVEVFPIPKAAPESTDSVGLSIPGNAASEASYREACRVAQILRQEFGMKVFELHTSSELTPATEEQFRRSFLG